MNRIEKILIAHDIKSEETFRESVNNTCLILNKLNEVSPFETLEDIPANTRQWGLEIYLESDSIAKELKRLGQLDENKIILPDSIQAIISAMNAAKSVDRNHLKLITRNEQGTFLADSDKIDSHCEITFKRYLTDPDQIARYKRAEALMELIKPELEMFDWDYDTEGRKYFNGFYWLKWEAYPVNRYRINLNWVRSGEIKGLTFGSR